LENGVPVRGDHPEAADKRPEFLRGFLEADLRATNQRAANAHVSSLPAGESITRNSAAAFVAAT
jgi:hypothetical protein